MSIRIMSDEEVHFSIVLALKNYSPQNNNSFFFIRVDLIINLSKDLRSIKINDRPFFFLRVNGTCRLIFFYTYIYLLCETESVRTERVNFLSDEVKQERDSHTAFRSPMHPIR